MPRHTWKPGGVEALNSLMGKREREFSYVEIDRIVLLCRQKKKGDTVQKYHLLPQK